MLHKLLVQLRLHIRNRKLDVLGPNVEKNLVLNVVALIRLVTI